MTHQDLWRILALVVVVLTVACVRPGRGLAQSDSTVRWQEILPTTGRDGDPPFGPLLYKWSSTAAELHRNIEKHLVIVDGLLADADPEPRLAALLLLSTHQWRGYVRFVPTHRTKKQAKVRRGYAAQVRKLMKTDGRWEVRVGCLLYWDSFPDLANWEEVLAVYRPEESFQLDDRYDRSYLGDLGYIVANRKSFEGCPLGRVAATVVCRSAPARGLQFLASHCQEEEGWWWPVLRTPAQFEITLPLLRKTSDEARKRLGGGLGSTLASLAYGYEAFLRQISSQGQFHFPRVAIEAALSDRDSGAAFRESLATRSRWLRAAGVDVDWRSAEPKDILRALERLMDQKSGANVKAPGKD